MSMDYGGNKKISIFIMDHKKDGFVETVEVEPRVNLKLKLTVFPVCEYLATTVPLPWAMPESVGVHVVHVPGVAHVKSMSVSEVFDKTCPVVPPLSSASVVSTPCPNVLNWVGRFVTKSAATGMTQPKFVVGFAICFPSYATDEIACA